MLKCNGQFSSQCPRKLPKMPKKNEIDDQHDNRFLNFVKCWAHSLLVHFEHICSDKVGSYKKGFNSI